MAPKGGKRQARRKGITVARSGQPPPTPLVPQGPDHAPLRDPCGPHRAPYGSHMGSYGPICPGRPYGMCAIWCCKKPAGKSPTPPATSPREIRPPSPPPPLTRTKWCIKSGRILKCSCQEHLRIRGHWPPSPPATLATIATSDMGLDWGSQMREL